MYQCDLQASNQRSCRSALKTQWVLAGWIPRAAQHPHREPHLLRVLLPARRVRLLEQSSRPTRLPVGPAEAPVPRGGGRLALLRLPEPESRSDQHPQRPPGQRDRPSPKHRGGGSHFPGHRWRCRQEHWQLRTLSIYAQITSLPQQTTTSMADLFRSFYFILFFPTCLDKGHKFNWNELPLARLKLSSHHKRAVYSSSSFWMWQSEETDFKCWFFFFLNLWIVFVFVHLILKCRNECERERPVYLCMVCSSWQSYCSF